ncbi:ribonuclease E inhibitor RraB [Shewanella litorisediminis]|uniref:Ribonuclease E inhibitor RraB n=1 Tax=Shewanella litorisediminis TaxID=1173586 RepID=A0ABX7G6U2_9GAMM|nr:ribonuclease E inhibitor RraB [Shewanella litorisediminis]MCL2916832.1 ribonuclease E inhibitor RraB [Shewanella litorisediminis]QRH03000.1 ribonuclease E inhibitor RraB [Shewanella litorisediminis]
MHFPEDDNGQMLKAMHESGIDLTKPLDVDFFLVFDDRRDAESALEDLTAQEAEGEVELNFNEELDKWELIVCINMLPEYDALVAREVELNAFAGQFDGQSDGWGVMQHQEGDDEFMDDEDDDHEHHCGPGCNH